MRIFDFKVFSDNLVTNQQVKIELLACCEKEVLRMNSKITQN